MDSSVGRQAGSLIVLVLELVLVLDLHVESVWIWEGGLEGRCLQRPGAAVRFRIGDTYDALSCTCRPPFDEGRSGSPPEITGLRRICASVVISVGGISRENRDLSSFHPTPANYLR